MEISKREIAFSIIIIAIMVGLGIVISRPIIAGANENAMKITCATQITTNENFDYANRTNVGDFLAYGTISAKDPVSIPDIQGQYLRIEKYEQEYTEHTREVTETDSDGNTHTYTETYWEWDTIHTDEYECEEVVLLGKILHTKNILGFRMHTSYNTTIYDRHFFGKDRRYVYYTCPKDKIGTLYGFAEDRKFKNMVFHEGTTIEQLVKRSENSGEEAVIGFWIFWGLLTIGAVIGFYYAENKWLY